QELVHETRCRARAVVGGRGRRGFVRVVEMLDVDERLGRARRDVGAIELVYTFRDLCRVRQCELDVAPSRERQGAVAFDVERVRGGDLQLAGGGRERNDVELSRPALRHERYGLCGGGTQVGDGEP